VTSQEDRRSVRHVITHDGEAALLQGDAAVAARLSGALDHLTAPQARKALEGLELLGKAMAAARKAREDDAVASRG
jgi:hypothetical protein